MSAPDRPALLASWLVQKRVIHALLMREILTRFGRQNIGFLWLFVEPMVFTLAVTALWTVAGATHGSSLPIAAFALTGYSSVLLWRSMPNRCIGAVGPNLALMYHRNVKIIDIYAARILLEFLGVTVSFSVLAVFFGIIGWIDWPENILMVYAAWLLLAWFGAALALLLGSMSERFDAVEKVWHPASYILFPLSGAAFLVDALPPAAQDVILWFPMVHGAEMLREGYFGSAVRSHFNPFYLLSVNVVLTGIGLANTRIIGRSVMPQ